MLRDIVEAECDTLILVITVIVVLFQITFSLAAITFRINSTAGLSFRLYRLFFGFTNNSDNSLSNP